MALCHVEDVLFKSSLQQYAEIPLKKVRFLTIPLGKTRKQYRHTEKKKPYTVYFGFITVLTV